uniref:Uncharacterized protein n=1 Tax=Zooxanthella nutricula TaxID=1333877 RepID=A0A6U6NXJ1_9DINO
MGGPFEFGSRVPHEVQALCEIMQDLWQVETEVDPGTRSFLRDPNADNAVVDAEQRSGQPSPASPPLPEGAIPPEGPKPFVHDQKAAFDAEQTYRPLAQPTAVSLFEGEPRSSAPRFVPGEDFVTRHGSVVAVDPLGDVFDSDIDESCLEDVDSVKSEDDASGQMDDVQIVLGPTHWAAAPHSLHDFQVNGVRMRSTMRTVSLIDILSLSSSKVSMDERRAGSPLSFGSIVHILFGSRTHCRPCMFDRIPSSCTRQWLCDFCHVHYHEGKKARTRNRMLSKAGRMAAASREDVSTRPVNASARAAGGGSYHMGGGSGAAFRRRAGATGPQSSDPLAHSLWDKYASAGYQ